ncbi:MAG: DUF3352 domain-containing protein [Thermoleophilia bacterium]|nr:DUF3352 domain-containing protein [Thermoleophilia bacterium]
MKLLRPPGALAAALASAAVLVAAACGGGGAGGGAAGGEGAALVPADVAAFVSVDTDFDSEQWAAVEALMARFPSGGEAIQSLVGSLTREGLDLETDIKPAFGPETSIAILELDQEQLNGGDNAPIVMLTKPTDAAKFQKLLEDGEDEAVTREVGDGWYMVADNDAIIDSVIADAGQASLADDPRYEEALADLPSESVATLYLNGQKLMASLEGEVDAAVNPLFDLGAGSLVSVAVALTAEAQGLSVDGVVRTEGAPEPTTYTAVLPGIVPADALLYASFSDFRTAVEKVLEIAAKQDPEFDSKLGQAQLGLGISIEDDLLPLFEGEHGLYVRSGLPIPEITLLLSPAEPQRGLATLDKLVANVAALAGLSGEDVPFTVTGTTIAGVPVKQLEIEGQEFSLLYALVGDTIVLTTQASGIADLVAGAGTLADDPLYEEATGAAALDDKTTGFLYVNMRDGLALLEQLGELAGASAAELEELRPLQYVVVQTGGDAGRTTFSGFLGIK